MQKTEQEFEQYRISQFGEPYLYSVNRNTFEKASAKNTFDSFFKEKLWSEENLYIVIGADSGLLVDYIIENGLPYDSRYIVIDLPSVVENIQSQITFTKWDDRIALCTPENWQEVAADFKIQSYCFREKITYIKSLSAIDAFNLDYHNLDTQISLEIESIQHKTMVNLSRKPFIKSQIENLSENTLPVIQLKKSLEGKTCVILGGGPSLDNNIDWIRKNQNDLIIIGVSRVANKLLQDGITPHIVLSVDPHDISFDVSKELLLLPNSVLFLHSNYCVPKLPAQWHGKNLYFGRKAPWKSKLNQENIGLTGPTVTNAAISAAIELGFKQILLTGVDLSYASDGRTYASGSNEAEIGPVLGMKGQWVETYSGELAETSTSFLHATHILAEQGKIALDNNSKIYNLSQTAAKVKNIDYISENDVLFEKQESITDLINNVPQLSPQELNQENKILLSEVNDLIKNLNEISGIAKQALQDNIALYKDYGNEEKNHKFKLKIDKAEKKLTSRFEHTTNFIKTFGIQHFIKSVRTDTAEEWSDEQMEETGRIYYQSFLDTIEELKPVLIDAKKRITSRIEEEKKSPNTNLLFNQWEGDEQFGRALLWKNRHTQLYETLTQSVQEGFESLCQKYHKEIANKDTAHYRRTLEEASLVGLNRKAVYLFQTNNIDGLTKLSSGLQAKINQEENAQWLYYLAKGYLLSLQGNKSESLESFEQLTDDYLTEDEALLMTKLYLELNLPEKAENKLKQLSEMSENYTPKYAHILKLNNKINLALDAYTRYLENNNNDISAWLSLGKLYLETGHNESAKMAFQSILQLEPNNIEANHLLAQL